MNMGITNEINGLRWNGISHCISGHYGDDKSSISFHNGGWLARGLFEQTGDAVMEEDMKQTRRVLRSLLMRLVGVLE